MLIVNGLPVLKVSDLTVPVPPHCYPSVAIGGLNPVMKILGTLNVIVIADSYTPHPHIPDKCQLLLPIFQTEATTNLFINGFIAARMPDMVNCGALTLSIPY